MRSRRVESIEDDDHRSPVVDADSPAAHSDAKNDPSIAVRGSGGYRDGADGGRIGVGGPAAMNLNDCHTKSALDRVDCGELGSAGGRSPMSDVIPERHPVRPDHRRVVSSADLTENTDPALILRPARATSSIDLSTFDPGRICRTLANLVFTHPTRRH